MPQPGKYGRRPADPSRPAIALADVLTGTIPAHPVTEDYLAALNGGWQVLGNDIAGNCNAVTWAGMRRLVTATLSTEDYPSQAEVWAFYETQNPGFSPAGTAGTNGPGSSDDQGMSVQVGLEYLHAHGGPDGVKPVAFAKVDPSNIPEVEAALAIFGCLWLGIQVLAANQDEFGAGQPWSDVAGSPVDGGHAILAGGYVPDVRFITWGQETEFAASFWGGSADGSPLVQEAWAVIWPEHLGTREFLAGVDVTRLASAYLAVTGKTLVLPVVPPGPAPAPAPAPAPGTASDALAAVAVPWLAHRHEGSGAEMAAALRTWLQAEGYPVPAAPRESLMGRLQADAERGAEAVTGLLRDGI
ncbi:MAG: hypothetical protein M3Y33_16135 [Actinomycetota bacterium]|nr:hypothetical protein [Actinomycetota bacterium]